MAVAIPLESLSNRVVSAEHIREIADTLEEIVQKGKLKDTQYTTLAEPISKKPLFHRVAFGTILRLMLQIFPKYKIQSGKSPKDLAEEFFKQRPKYLIPEKVAQAIELLKDPKASINGVAKQVGLANTTLTAALKQSGFYKKPTLAERGLRVLQGRGQNPDTLSYKKYFSLETVEITTDALRKNNGNKKGAVKELIVKLGERKATELLNTVFPEYLLQNGIDFCLERYKSWLALKPKSVTGPNKEIVEKQKRELQRVQLNKVKNSAVDILVTILQKRIQKSDIINQDLFLRIAKDILLGRSATYIGYTHRIPELTVVGVRRRMVSYFETKWSIDAKTKAEPLTAFLLNQTKF